MDIKDALKLLSEELILLPNDISDHEAGLTLILKYIKAKNDDLAYLKQLLDLYPNSFVDKENEIKVIEEEKMKEREEKIRKSKGSMKGFHCSIVSRLCCERKEKYIHDEIVSLAFSSVPTHVNFLILFCTKFHNLHRIRKKLKKDFVLDWCSVRLEPQFYYGQLMSMIKTKALDPSEVFTDPERIDRPLLEFIRSHDYNLYTSLHLHRNACSIF